MSRIKNNEFESFDMISSHLKSKTILGTNFVTQFSVHGFGGWGSVRSDIKNVGVSCDAVDSTITGTILKSGRSRVVWQTVIN